MALTEDLGSLFQVKFGTLQVYTAGATIYRGATIALRLATGLVYPAILNDSPDADLNQLIVGYSRSGAIAAASLTVQREGRVIRNFTGGTPLVGTLACVYDDETVQAYRATVGAMNVVVGRITEVLDATRVYVDFGDRPKRIATSIYD